MGYSYLVDRFWGLSSSDVESDRQIDRQADLNSTRLNYDLSNYNLSEIQTKIEKDNLGEHFRKIQDCGTSLLQDQIPSYRHC